MNYTIANLMNGASMMAESVFGKRDEYHLQFNHENDGCWYIDFPNWPFDHHNLMMVAGADDMCAYFSTDGKFAYVDVIPAEKEEDHPGYAKCTQKEHGLTTGSTYQVENLPGFEKDIWICPVTLFVLGKYPKYLYIKKTEK